MTLATDIQPKTPSAGRRVRRAVLLSLQRTGSTMVVRHLNTHPRAFFIGALFSNRGWLGNGKGRRLVKRDLGPEWNSLPYRVAHQRELLDKIVAASRADCVGFKHHLSAAADVTQTAIDDPDNHVVLLTRNNLLACFSSNEMIDVKWTESVGLSGDTKAHFHAGRFEQFMDRRKRILDRWYDKIVSRSGPNMVIDYTEARASGGTERIAEFLGLDSSLLGSQLTKKRNSDQLDARFSNPGEVRAYLAAKGYESWLVES